MYSKQVLLKKNSFESQNFQISDFFYRRFSYYSSDFKNFRVRRCKVHFNVHGNESVKYRGVDSG